MTGVSNMGNAWFVIAEERASGMCGFGGGGVPTTHKRKLVRAVWSLPAAKSGKYRTVPYGAGQHGVHTVAACTACTATHLLHVCTLCLLHILLHEYYLHRTVRPQCSSSHPILQALRQP